MHSSWAENVPFDAPYARPIAPADKLTPPLSLHYKSGNFPPLTLGKAAISGFQ